MVDTVDLEGLWARRFATPDLAALVEQLPQSPHRLLFEAHLASVRGDISTALAKATESAAQFAEPDAWRARALRRKSALLADLGLVDEAIATSNLALDAAQTAGDRAVLAGILQDRATLPFNGAEAAVAKFREALVIAEESGADDIRALIRLNLTFTPVGYLSTVDRLAELDLAEPLAEHSWPELHLRILARRAELHLEDGNPQMAARIAAQLPGPETLSDPNFACGMALTLAKIDLAVGRPHDAVDRLSRFAQTALEDDQTELLPVLSEAYEAMGDLASALRTSREERRLLLQRADARAAAATRALEIWFRTEQATAETRRQQARADELESALEQLRDAHDRIHAISTHDALTGVYNRQYVMDHGLPMLEQRGDGGQVPEIAMIDVDRFKSLNDEHGHGFGDAVLVRVAQLLRARLRPEDIVARLGGDEFVIIRPAEGSGDLAADMRAIVADLDNQAWRETDHVGAGQVSISVGVTAADSGDAGTALHLADLLMYAAKRAGGARVCSDLLLVDQRLGRPPSSRPPGSAGW